MAVPIYIFMKVDFCFIITLAVLSQNIHAQEIFPEENRDNVWLLGSSPLNVGGNDVNKLDFSDNNSLVVASLNLNMSFWTTNASICDKFGQLLFFTNGIEVSPDGQQLYVNESVQRNVWAFDITDNRQLADKRLIRRFDDFGFDGMRCDIDGNLYITRHGKGTVIRMSPTGEILQEVPVLGTKPTNLCFGGPDGCTVYVTEVDGTRLVSFRTDRPGRSHPGLHPTP